MKKIRMYLPLLAKQNQFQKIFATFLHKFFGFLIGLKYRLYMGLGKVEFYVVCKGPDFKRTLEKGPFIVSVGFWHNIYRVWHLSRKFIKQISKILCIFSEFWNLYQEVLKFFPQNACKLRILSNFPYQYSYCLW